MDESEINKLLSELNSIKQEVRDLRIKITAQDRKKEELFKEKRKVSSDIYSRIKDAQGAKEKRNNLTDVVKNSKLSREELEKHIKELETGITTLKTDRHKLLAKLGVEDPMMLKKNIKHLEFKIETEGLTFDKEKELMKVLSKMKKQYESVKQVTELDHKLDHHFRELRDLREQFDMTRKIVQSSAKESQKHHVELIENSKEIDELKKKEQTFETQIMTFKNAIHELSEQINGRLSRMDEIKKILHDNDYKLKEDVDRSNNEILRQKDSEVQDKLKKGKKLTTEDLLILQRTMKN